MTDEAERKSEARKVAFVVRKAARSDVTGARAVQHLLETLTLHIGKVISGYMPIKTEISPLPAMLGMIGWSPVTVPVIQGEGLPLIFREWRPDSAMIDGPFGALVPADGAFLEPQVMIVPLLSFDRQGYRLGYGGGFYDRTIEALRAQGDVLTIGFAFAGQEVESVPRDEHDQRLDMVVTEEGVQRFSDGFDPA